MRRELRWYHPAWWLRAAIRGYQRVVSPSTAPRCRYRPTCSEFAVEALEVHGAVRGSAFALKRIVSCNPLNRNGFQYHPVPPRPHAEVKIDA